MKSLRNSAERSFSVWEQVVLRWCPFRCFLIASTPTTGAERTPTAGPTGTKTGQKITPVITRNFFILGSNGKHIRPGRISRGRKSSTSPWFPLSTRSMSRNSLSNSWKPLWRKFCLCLVYIGSYGVLNFLDLGTLLKFSEFLVKFFRNLETFFFAPFGIMNFTFELIGRAAEVAADPAVK